MSSTQRQFALIIASDCYTDKKLSQLKAPIVDANRLSQLLQSIDSGFDVTNLHNKESHVIKKEIERFFRKAEKNDLLLLYFAGHGHKSIEDGLLYLATLDSELEYLDSTTIPAKFINSQIQKSKSTKIVLILDCCYSGAFARDMIARAEDKVLNVKDEFRESGCVVLTSGTSMQFSFEGNKLKLGEQISNESSYYTNLLIKGIESGEADLDKDNSITCSELNEYIRQKLREIRHPQKPEIYILKGDITIAKKQVIEKFEYLHQLHQFYWDQLLDSIHRARCIPFIGDSALEYFNQIDGYACLTSKGLAKELAEKYDYPFEGPYQLPKVTQYLATEQENDMLSKFYISNRLSKLKPPDFHSDLLNKSPQAILAKLNLPIYVTTNYDLLLENALKSGGKMPVSEVCSWNKKLIKAIETGTINSRFKKDEPFYPTREQPLVYHLHGSVEYPSSLVLTEQDYSDFLKNMKTRSDVENKLLPAVLKKNLMVSSLLFIGYYIDDVNFDSIFKGAYDFMLKYEKKYRSTKALISLPPINIEAFKQEKALKYLQKSFAHKYKIDVEFTYSNQFINELPTQWERFIMKL